MASTQKEEGKPKYKRGVGAHTYSAQPEDGHCRAAYGRTENIRPAGQREERGDHEDDAGFGTQGAEGECVCPVFRALP